MSMATVACQAVCFPKGGRRVVEVSRNAKSNGNNIKGRHVLPKLVVAEHHL